jgi:hypothetical protein
MDNLNVDHRAPQWPTHMLLSICQSKLEIDLGFADKRQFCEITLIYPRLDSEPDCMSRRIKQQDIWKRGFDIRLWYMASKKTGNSLYWMCSTAMISKNG